MEVKRLTAKSLVSQLTSVSAQTRTDALCQLRLISKHDPDSRHVIVYSGALPLLSELLYSPSAVLQENAAATLLNLSLSGRHPLMSTRGLLDSLSHALRHPASPPAAQAASAVIYSLLTEDHFRPIIGSKRDIVFALIDLVRSPSSTSKSIKDALKALFGISLYPLNRATVIELGAVPAFFSLVMKDGRVGVLEDTTAVLAQIAGCEEAEAAFNKVSGIGVLADLLDPATGSSARTKENAVSALLNLVQCCGERVKEEARDSVVQGFGGIVDVASNGSAKGRDKAIALLRVLDPAADVALRDLQPDSFYPSSQGSS